MTDSTSRKNPDEGILLAYINYLLGERERSDSSRWR
jgi:hypothetical protein